MGTRRKKLFALSPVYIFVIVFNSFLELKKKMHQIILNVMLAILAGLCGTSSYLNSFSCYLMSAF